MKKTLMMAMLFLMLGVACKDKKESAPAKAEQQDIEKQTPAVPDTTKKAEKGPELKPEPEPAPEPDKYFLIAGSFSSPDNARSFQKELAEQGFESEVITRNWGKNSEFYKVSYMGFKDKQEAISTMKRERQKEKRDSVWVLVKR